MTESQNLQIKGKDSKQHHEVQKKGNLDNDQLLQIIDKSLKHLNHISQANITAQELYIELLKEKKTMKFDQIKKIYRTLTQGKAKQILFQRDKKQLIQTDYQNHEGLIRICWRSIQKLVKKITYYMINENHLSIISKSVLKLIQLNQHFVRRFQKLKNSSMLFILQIIQKLIEQNSILEQKIYDILLSRGYVVSLDEFYKLNGYDTEHRQTYYAKQQSQKVNQPSDQDEQPKNINQLNKKQSQSSSKKQGIRKKKVFRTDCRYSWKQKLDLNQQQTKQKYPVNKTNYQIRESFQKFIGDFLQNENLTEALQKYNFDDESEDQNSKNEKQEKFKKKEECLSTNYDTLIHKKIFQNKIQSTLNQLKSNNIKMSSKILQIINNSSNQVINNKITLGQKKLIQRKNSQKRQSNLLLVQRKLRQSHLINDRKIVNQNFFRQLLRRNTNIQNYINQQILQDTQKISQQLQFFNLPPQKVNPNHLKFDNKQLITKQANMKRVSNFAPPNKGNAVFLFNHKNNFNIKNKQNNQNNRYFQTELNCKYKLESKRLIESRKNIQSKNNINEGRNESIAQKIRLLKEQQGLKDQRNILEIIENATLDPNNPKKFAQILKRLNRQKGTCLQLGTIIDEQVQDETYQNKINLTLDKDYKNKKSLLKRFKTEFGQQNIQACFNNNLDHLNIKNILKKKQNSNNVITKLNQGELKGLEVYPSMNRRQSKTQKRGEKSYRLKTQGTKYSETSRNLSRSNKIEGLIRLNLNSKEKTYNYQIYDRRLRRFIAKR